MEATATTELTHLVEQYIAAMTSEDYPDPEPVTRLVEVGATEEDIDAIQDYACGDSPFMDVAELVSHLSAGN